MSRARILPLTRIALLCLLILAGACGREGSGPAAPQRGASPLEEPWFRELLPFLQNIHSGLADPTRRVELRLQLLAGREDRAGEALGLRRDQLSSLFARLERLRPELEARWPELREGSGAHDPPAYPAELLRILQSGSWLPVESEATKTREDVCAAIELYENLSRCTSWNPFAQAFCMYQAYLRYLEHRALGCGG